MDYKQLTDIVRASRNGVIIDTNLLTIYLVSLYREDEVSRFLTKKCLVEDTLLIKGFLQRYKLRCVVTPQILAEVSNLTFEKFHEPGLTMFLQKALSYASASREEYTHKDQLIDKYHLPRLGFSDSSIIEASKKNGYLVMTEDLGLHHTLLSERCPAINISHLRQMTF